MVNSLHLRCTRLQQKSKYVLLQLSTRCNMSTEESQRVVYFPCLVRIVSYQSHHTIYCYSITVSQNTSSVLNDRLTLFLVMYSIFTFFGMFLEVAALWAYRKENAPTSMTQEKNDGSRAPLDAPVDPAPTTTV